MVVFEAGGKTYTYYNVEEKADDARKWTMKIFGYRLFPQRNGPEFSADGQPQYEQFCDLDWRRFFLTDAEVEDLVRAKAQTVPANNLYADGPMQLFYDGTHGIKDVEAFVTSTLKDDL
jgi:hypothetical protein